MRPVWLNAWSSCSVFSIIAVKPQLYLLYFAIREARLIVSAAGVQKFSHDCFYKTIMEDELRKLDLQSCRDRIVVTGIGSNNCVYHAVIGFHIRNYFVTVPEDCIHANREEGQTFALSQFRSPAYNFNIDVVRSEQLVFSADQRSAVA